MQGQRSLVPGNAGLGYRHSEYDRAGGADAYKAELMYRPVDALRIRGSYQHAIRAPSITELFTPQLPEFLFFGPSRDPCEAGSSARTGPNATAVESLCLAQGLPAALLDLCFDARVNPDFSPEQTWCTFFTRNTESGDVEDMYEIARNLGEISTSGIDLQLDWQLPLGPGTFGVNWLITWLDSFERGAGAGAPVEDLAGEISFLPGTSLAEWRSLLSLSYGWRNASVTARSRYIDSMRDTFAPEYRVPSRTYLDLFAGYDFGPGLFDGLRLGFGIENVTDRNPPVFPSYIAANTDPQQFVTINYRF